MKFILLLSRVEKYSCSLRAPFIMLTWTYWRIYSNYPRAVNIYLFKFFDCSNVSAAWAAFIAVIVHYGYVDGTERGFDAATIAWNIELWRIGLEWRLFWSDASMEPILGSTRFKSFRKSSLFFEKIFLMKILLLLSSLASLLNSKKSIKSSKDEFNRIKRRFKSHHSSQ